MRSLTLRCDSNRALLAVPVPTGMLILCLTVTTLGVFCAAPAGCGWQVTPEIRVSAGEESDLLVDPEVTRTLIVGGPFAELGPALYASTWVGDGTFIHLGTFATLQRFLNDESRLLYAHTLQGSVFHDLGSSFRGRLSASGDYFDDSERSTVRRLAAGGELGVAFLRPRWSAEVWGGGSGRRYPNFAIEEREGQTTTYSEGTWRGGTTLRISPSRNVELRADGILQSTDSRDPYFDSRSWTARGNIDTPLFASLFLTASAAYQEREFSNRATGEDTDRYWQIGLGLRYVFESAWAVSVRWGHSRYSWPDENVQDSRRLAIGLHHTWGNRSAPHLPSVNAELLSEASGGSVQEPDIDGNVLFRIRAVDAQEVMVAGSFNAWDPEATPLRRDEDGWWEARIKLAPGLYEYAYVIDGAWTAPPEALTTVPDGFGGHNGILEVLPAGL